MPGAMLVGQKQGDISVLGAQGNGSVVWEKHSNEGKAVASSSQWWKAIIPLLSHLLGVRDKTGGPEDYRDTGETNCVFV